MNNTVKLLDDIENGVYDAVLQDVYVDESLVAFQKERYVKAVKSFVDLFGNQDVMVISAPGRSEIGGNHTDHQLGKVLATSVNIDIIAVVAESQDGCVHMQSEGYRRLDLDLSDLSVQEKETGHTASLIRGVAAGMQARGFKTGGFMAYATSQVLSGSGLSSSAAFEVLVGNIQSHLYNGGSVDSITIAQIGQLAENKYFGKPSGLMDQMACSVGGLIHIDFKDPAVPLVEKVEVDFKEYHHSLCIVDTKGSHADLTNDYAEIPLENKKVAAHFGKAVLREVDEEAFYQELPAIRKEVGGRAVLRAIHFYDDCRRVDQQKEALLAGDFEGFKSMILASGESSYKYLQNVYAVHKTEDESMAVALALTEKLLRKDGAWRVHGGGFAGTILVFVPDEKVADYKAGIERIFGDGTCHVLKVRSYGGCRVI